jgi:hypothetical protein
MSEADSTVRGHAFGRGSVRGRLHGPFNRSASRGRSAAHVQGRRVLPGARRRRWFQTFELDSKGVPPGLVSRSRSLELSSLGVWPPVLGPIVGRPLQVVASGPIDILVRSPDASGIERVFCTAKSNDDDLSALAVPTLSPPRRSRNQPLRRSHECLDHTPLATPARLGTTDGDGARAAVRQCPGRHRRSGRYTRWVGLPPSHRRPELRGR